MEFEEFGGGLFCGYPGLGWRWDGMGWGLDGRLSGWERWVVGRKRMMGLDGEEEDCGVVWIRGKGGKGRAQEGDQLRARKKGE